MVSVDRRRFLSWTAAAAAASALQATPFAFAAEPASVQDFEFIFFTDTHIEPELDAAHGCAMAFRRMRDVRADFAIQGGDHVFDSLGVPKVRSVSLFELYDKTQQDLSLKVYHTIGNHDCVGVYAASGMAVTDPLYGKKYYEDHVGRTYYSFDHKGVHFIILDSIGITEDRAYEGRIDAGQLQWLRADLANTPAARPIIVSVHIPLVTAFDSYVPLPAHLPAHHGGSVANSAEVIPLFAGHHVLAVLQGHTHINERVEWQGIPYITSGAVSGNWWKGVRMGTPEGYTVVSIREGKLTTRYETYGFHSVVQGNG